MPKRKQPLTEPSSSGTAAYQNFSVGVCLLIVALSVVIGVLWTSPSFNVDSGDGIGTSTSMRKSGSSEKFVERRRYDGKQSYKEIAEMRKPLILTGTIVDRWPARNYFTTKFLAGKIKHVMAHIQENKRTFVTFHDNKPLEDHVTEKWKEFNIKVNTTIPNVLQWDGDKADPSKGPYLYYTQDVATMSSQFPDVIGYLQPIKDLILSDENVQVNLWVGRQGIVTHTHYDCTYNFFFQLQGKKRFTLFPPSENLYLYPCLHPHYGHSQVDILNPDYDIYPLFKSEGSIVAELGPGDMLVVPPFWYHHVETLVESVSVNVWSDAPEYALINQVYSLPIPFEETWSKAELIVATKVYIDMILLSLKIENTSLFVTNLLEDRYDILLQTGRLKLNTTVKEPLNLCDNHDWESHFHTYQPVLQRGVNKVSDILLKIPVRSTLEICAANFIEHLVYSILGLDTFYSFLKHCYTTIIL